MPPEQPDWEAIRAPLDPAVIKTRKQKTKTGYINVRYIDARDVQDRLNEVCPGNWSFSTQLVSAPTKAGEKWVFKGSLRIGGVVREDVGMNEEETYFDPPKSAVSDCLKRCAVHFGIGRELYDDEPSPKAPAKRPPEQPEDPPITQARANELLVQVKALDIEDAFENAIAFVHGSKPDELTDLTQTEVERLDGWLEEKINKANQERSS